MHAGSRVAWFAMNMYTDREPGYVSPEGDLGYYNKVDPILHEFLRDLTPYLRRFTKTLGRREDNK